MLDALTGRHPGIPTLIGTGERLPLDDASVDAVTFGQAWHWVDPAAASPEVARVLRPGGVLGLFWNLRDESVDWVHELSGIMHPSTAETMIAEGGVVVGCAVRRTRAGELRLDAAVRRRRSGRSGGVTQLRDRRDARAAGGDPGWRARPRRAGRRCRRPGRDAVPHAGLPLPYRRMSRRTRMSQKSILSIGSSGSILSIGSVGSILSIGSVGSIGSIGSAGSAFSILSWLSFGSVMSAISVFSVLSWLSRRAPSPPLAGCSGRSASSSLQATEGDAVTETTSRRALLGIGGVTAIGALVGEATVLPAAADPIAPAAPVTPVAPATPMSRRAVAFRPMLRWAVDGRRERRPRDARRCSVEVPVGKQYTTFSAAATAGAAMRVPSSVFDRGNLQSHLLRRVTFGARPKDVADLRKLGVNRWLVLQLTPSKIVDTEGVATWKSFPLAGATTKTILSKVEKYSWDAMLDTTQATLARQVFSDRQLYEIVVDVFANHLHVPLPGEQWHTSPSYLQDVIRKHAFGRYEDMLLAAMKHPAMLNYLSNDESRAADVNENLGRELLELHTVGRAAGYTEAMVRSSAKIMSGRGAWDPDTGQYFFRAPWHWTGRVKVLGFTHANASIYRGEAVGDAYLRYLARHPATARTIARKLAVRFVSDTPSASLVNRLAHVYLTHGTSIRAVVDAIFKSSDFWAAVGVRMRRPLEDAVGSLRVLDVQRAAQMKTPLGWLYWNLNDAGHTPHGWGPPNGYPDVAAAWLGAGAMLQRWNLHRAFVTGGGSSFGWTPPSKLVPRTAGMTTMQWTRAVSRLLLVHDAVEGPPARRDPRREAHRGLVRTEWGLALRQGRGAPPRLPVLPAALARRRPHGHHRPDLRRGPPHPAPRLPRLAAARARRPATPPSARGRGPARGGGGARRRLVRRLQPPHVPEGRPGRRRRCARHPARHEPRLVRGRGRGVEGHAGRRLPPRRAGRPVDARARRGPDAAEGAPEHRAAGRLAARARRRPRLRAAPRARPARAADQAGQASPPCPRCRRRTSPAATSRRRTAWSGGRATRSPPGGSTASSVASGPGTTFRSVAVGGTTPRSLVGASNSIAMRDLDSITLNVDTTETAATTRALSSLYTGIDHPIAKQARLAIGALGTVAKIKAAQPAASVVTYPEGNFGDALQNLAMLIKGGAGVRVACIDVGGWDTHTGMGTADSGDMQRHLGDLATGARRVHRRPRLRPARRHHHRDDERVRAPRGGERERRHRPRPRRRRARGRRRRAARRARHVEGPVGTARRSGDVPGWNDYRDVLTEVVSKRLNISQGAMSNVFPAWTPAPIGVMA